MATRDLRIAAICLIVHYLLVLGLAAFGKGPFDHFHAVVTLGMLLAAAATLFRPWQNGWIFILVYAWYAANPSLLNLTSIWTSAEVPHEARVTASLVMTFVHAPLVAALVLVFQPSGFAVFRALKDAPGGKPVPLVQDGRTVRPEAVAATATSATSAGMAAPVGSQSRRAIGVVVLGVLLLIVAPLLPNAAVPMAIPIGLSLIAYVPIMLFAVKAKFRSTALRYFFGFSAVPVFAVLFFWVLHRFVVEFPLFADTFGESMAQGGRRAGMGHGLIVLAVSSAAFGIWYGMVRALDRFTERIPAGTGTAAAVAFALACSGATLWVAYDAGLIGSTEWRTARREYGGASPSREWMTEAQLQAEYKRWHRSSFYPSEIVAKCHNGVVWYRVVWKTLQNRQHYYFYYGLPKDTFDRYDRELRAKGYAPVSMTQFRDCAGGERFQGTWVRTGAP